MSMNPVTFRFKEAERPYGCADFNVYAFTKSSTERAILETCIVSVLAIG